MKLSKWALTAALVGCLVGALLAVVAASRAQRVYQATATTFVIAAPSGDSTSSAYLVQQQVQSFAQLASTPLVLERTAKKLGDGTSMTDVENAVNVKASLNTSIITLSGQASTPESAQRLANALTDAFSESVVAYAPKSENGQALVLLKKVSDAELPTDPVAPRRSVYLVTGALLGLLVGLVADWLRRRLPVRVTSSADLRRAGMPPLIASVPAIVRPTLQLPPFRRSRIENMAFGSLMTSILAGRGERSSVNVLIIPTTRDCQVAENLASSGLLAGLRTLLVSRRPRTQVEGLDKMVVTRPLRELVGHPDELRATLGSFSGMGTAYVPADDDPLLTRVQALELNEAFNSEVNLTVIDAAPLQESLNALAWVPAVDHTVLVVRSGTLTDAQIDEQIALIDSCGSPRTSLVFESSGGLPGWARVGRGGVDPARGGSAEAPKRPSGAASPALKSAKRDI